MDMSPAPFLADIAKGPEGGSARWMITADGLRIRVGHWPAADNTTPKGTVLMFPGRTEFIEKFGLSAADLCARGYTTLAIDWRGQGMADRMLADSRLGHVDNFRDYQQDVAAVLRYAAAEALPKPWYLVGHSMGGSIGLRALYQGLDVKACAFTGPMWGIRIPPLLLPLANFLCRYGRQFGVSNKLAPTLSVESYVRTTPFRDNSLTSDPEMFDYIRMQVEAYPGFGLGGPTINWTAEALQEAKALDAKPSPDIPCLTFLGTEEEMVDKTVIRARMARWPNGKLVELPAGRHELLLEHKAMRDDLHNQLAMLFSA
jgi:lysophospholipase